MQSGQIAAGPGPEMREQTAAPRGAGLVLRLGAALLAAAAILAALTMLWHESAGIETTELRIGDTPATLYALPGTEAAPLVVVAHGFAGSRQFMQGFSLTLARSGYAALAFDFQGHGRNPAPMSGDVNAVDGTTQRLIDETNRVIAAGLARREAGGGLALVGHSMATDVLVRAAAQRDDVDAIAAVSMYSEAVTAETPHRLLMVTGQWEPHLREAALDYMGMVTPGAVEGETAQSGEIVRRAVVAPYVEHVGVLYSETTLTEVRAWLDDTFGRESAAPVAQRGPWVALLMVGIVALAWPVFSAFPERGAALVPTWRAIALATVLPALAAPLVLWPVETSVLPVLVADYLAFHLAVYGALQIGLLYAMGYRLPLGGGWAALALALYGIGVFGLALDAFGASFVPHAGRLPIIAAVALGAVPFMLGDALATAGGRAPLLRRLAVRLGLFVSLAIAVSLDFEGLFFVVLILPIILLFFVIYGTMGGWIGRRAGPLAQGLGLGFCLAWAIGVSFPLFSA
ncbi:MAG: alpha/beta fold hydrolase [Pseudomonadota bacterium]